jgi:hypothetical protein
MLSSERVAWAHQQSNRDLIRFAMHQDQINLPGCECYAVMMVLACRLESALDRDEFEQSGLDFDPDVPVVAEAADAASDEEVCEMIRKVAPYVGRGQPRQSTFGETFAKIDREAYTDIDPDALLTKAIKVPNGYMWNRALSPREVEAVARARRLHTQPSDSEMARHAAAFNVPENVP